MVDLYVIRGRGCWFKMWCLAFLILGVWEARIVHLFWGCGGVQGIKRLLDADVLWRNVLCEISILEEL